MITDIDLTRILWKSTTCSIHPLSTPTPLTLITPFAYTRNPKGLTLLLKNYRWIVHNYQIVFILCSSRTYKFSHCRVDRRTHGHSNFMYLYFYISSLRSSVNFQANNTFPSKETLNLYHPRTFWYNWRTDTWKRLFYIPIKGGQTKAYTYARTRTTVRLPSLR